jgi:hypothetical protein
LIVLRQLLIAGIEFRIVAAGLADTAEQIVGSRVSKGESHP